MSSEDKNTIDHLISRVLELTKKINQNCSSWLAEVEKTSERLIEQYSKGEISEEAMRRYIDQINKPVEEIIECIRTQTLDGHGRYFFKP